jgi:hypothetical protein
MDRLYVCSHCDWSLPEPDLSDYPDTEHGQENLAADYAYFDLEKEQHDCVTHIMESFDALRGRRLSL